ncbi:MAG TPA: radical SAM protein [Armatimonadetes bacterium]|nr:radical SAM protein [Armatimonadota bacterium]
MRDLYPGIKLRPCAACGESKLLTAALGVCADCLRAGTEEVERLIRQAHAQTRPRFGLPLEPPHTTGGRECRFCVNRCRLGEGEIGYCGTKRNEGGKLVHLYGVQRGALDWYNDPIPTNCVSEWVCGACERGGVNLAVFLRACSFNCLFCQNWQFKSRHRRAEVYTPEQLAACVRERTVCICYFGGDPAPQAVFTIFASQKAQERKPTGPLRFCWETNGSENPRLMRKMASLALESGGTIKIDLKAFTPRLHRALTGTSNQWTLENVRQLARRGRERPEPPLLVVSTLLVPGYVGPEEVGRIATFLAELSSDIPYSLLAFYPQFTMTDLPPTSRAHAEACLAAAQSAGLTRVRVGNLHLLW